MRMKYSYGRKLGSLPKGRVLFDGGIPKQKKKKKKLQRVARRKNR